MSDLTLQINLSPGDLAYADQTVPALLRAHPGVAERLLIVDVCKPQRTSIVDPEKRFPEPAFTQRADAIVAFAEKLRARGTVDRVVVLRPGNPLLETLRSKYLRSWVRETHDYGGCALTAYLAAFETCRTRWLLHYDSDLLVYQAPSYDWATDAQARIANDPAVVAASPRPAPPAAPPEADAPTNAERLALQETPAGWLNTWFSTRCFLFDLDRLRPHLPLLQGRVYWETVIARLRGQGYPRSPEALLFRRMTAAQRSRLTLRDSRAWLLHPTQKDAVFLAALPEILAAVGRGNFPSAQRGEANLQLDAWQHWLAARDV